MDDKEKLIDVYVTATNTSREDIKHAINCLINVWNVIEQEINRAFNILIEFMERNKIIELTKQDIIKHKIPVKVIKPVVSYKPNKRVIRQCCRNNC